MATTLPITALFIAHYAANSALRVARAWRPDAISLFVGLLLGISLAYAFLRLLPHLLALIQPPATAPPAPANTIRQRSHNETVYRQALAALVDTHHFGKALAPLHRLFIAPRLLSSQPAAHPEKPGPLAAAQLANLWPHLGARIAAPPPPTISLRSLLLNAQRVILSAPPGTGKSTLLAQTAHICASVSGERASRTEFGFLHRHLPVLLHFDDLRFQPGDATEESLPPLHRAIQRQFPRLADPLPLPLLEQKAETGHLLLLLDGWSEVNDDTRAYAVSWLRGLLARYPATIVWVTASERGFEPLLNLDFVISGPAPWRAAEAHQLGQRWAAPYDALEVPALQKYWQPQQSIMESVLRLYFYYEGVEPRAHHLFALLQAALEHVSQHSAVHETPPATYMKFWQRLAISTFEQGTVQLNGALVTEIAQATAPEDDIVASLLASLDSSPFYRPTSSGAYRWSSTLWRDHLAAAYLAQSEQAANLRKFLRDPARNGILPHLAYLDNVADLASWILEATVSQPDYDDLFHVASWLQPAKGQRDHNAWQQNTLIRIAQLITHPEASDIQRLRAIAVLPDCNDSSTLPLLQQLCHRSDPAIRQLAIAALGRITPEQSVPILAEMLADSDPDVRVAAVHALGWQQNPLAHEQLMLLLIGRDDLLRFAVVEALAAGGPDAWQTLREALTDEDPRVRRAAAHGLINIEQPWADELLRHLQGNDDEWLVQSAAARALESRARRRRPQPWRPLQASSLDWVVQWSARNNQAAPGGAAAVTLLCELVSTAPEKSIRTAAARVLAQVAIPAEERNAVWATLWQATRVDSSGQVREAAHETLAFLRRVRGP